MRKLEALLPAGRELDALVAERQQACQLLGEWLSIWADDQDWEDDSDATHGDAVAVATRDFLKEALRPLGGHVSEPTRREPIVESHPAPSIASPGIRSHGWVPHLPTDGELAQLEECIVNGHVPAAREWLRKWLIAEIVSWEIGT